MHVADFGFNLESASVAETKGGGRVRKGGE